MNIAQFIIDIAAKGDGQAVSKIHAVQKGLDSASRSAGQLRTGLKQAFSSLPGAEFIMNPIVALTAGIGVVTKLGMETEKAATSFATLVGSEELAAKKLAELNKYADNTIWSRNTVQEVSKTMLGFGVSVNTVVNDMKMLANVSVGDKNRLYQLAIAFGQIKSYGHLAGQELRQLINAGYNPLMDISEMTGKSMGQLQKEMADGLISFDMVRAAFQRATGAGGRFEDMTEKLAQTSAGAYDKLKGKLISSLLELYNVIQPLVIPVLKALGNALDALAKMAQWVRKNMSWLAPVLTTVTIGLGAYVAVTKAATVASAAFAAVLKIVNIVMALNPIGLIVAGIAALVAAIVICWNKFAGFRAVIMTVWDTVKGFGDVLKQYVLDRITGIIEGIGNLGRAIGKLFKGDFAGAWETAKTGAQQLRGVDARSNALTAASNLAGGVRSAYASNLAAERSKQAAKDAIKDPKAAAGTSALTGGSMATATTGGASASSTANAITTGGTRNTSIVLNIGKFFEDVNINNTSNKDFRELRDAVLESVNRSLEIAISAAR